MGWTLAPCLGVLRDQINAAYPGRDKASDGTIGDTAHQAQGAPTFNVLGYGVHGSDHDPDANGYVCALDIDDDLGPEDSWALAQRIAASKDSRISYLISHGKIFSSKGGTQPFAWRSYGGADGHYGHLHVSVRHTRAERDSTAPWVVTSEVIIDKPTTPAPSNKRIQDMIVPMSQGSPADDSHRPCIAISEDRASLIAYYCAPFDPKDSHVKTGIVQTFSPSAKIIGMSPVAGGEGLLVLKTDGTTGVVKFVAGWKASA